MEQLELIRKCLEQLKLNTYSKKIYQDYFSGNHDIKNNYQRVDARSNQIVVKNFPKLFINKEVAYLLSNPVNYISKDGDNTATNTINLNFSTWEILHNQNLLRNCLIYGESYELCYINQDKEFSAIALNPLNAYVLEDGTADRNVLMGLHYYIDAIDAIGTTNNSNIKYYLDVYTDKEIIKFRVDSFTIIEELERRNHNFNRVPMQKLTLDDYGFSSIEDYKSLQDSYNTTLSNYQNECNDHRNAILFSTGMSIRKDPDTGEKEDFYQEVNDKGWVNAKNEKAKMEYVTKEIGTFVDNLLKNIKGDIYESACHINEAESPTSNTSGDALRQRLHSLENKVSLMKSALEFVLKRRLKLFFEYYYVLTGNSFDYRLISCKFTLNIPKEITTLANAIPNLKQVFSNTSILSMFGTVENPDIEFKKWIDQQDMELNYNTDEPLVGDNNGTTE